MCCLLLFRRDERVYELEQLDTVPAATVLLLPLLRKLRLDFDFDLAETAADEDETPAALTVCCSMDELHSRSSDKPLFSLLSRLRFVDVAFFRPGGRPLGFLVEVVAV